MVRPWTLESTLALLSVGNNGSGPAHCWRVEALMEAGWWRVEGAAGWFSLQVQACCRLDGGEWRLEAGGTDGEWRLEGGGCCWLVQPGSS